MEGKLFKGRYQLKTKLGTGRLGDTYLADDQQLGRQVAVKVLFQEFASNEAYIQKLEAEARVATGLESPAIVRPLDWGSEDGLYFVVTDYVEGRSLAQLLSSEGGRVPAERAARVVSEICGALQLAHARGLIHCGISTSNIFMDELGQVKLMDLGMAWEATGRGTPEYVSPEQAQGLAPDARSDLYSLGVVLYQTLTGKVPFEGPDSQTVIAAQINQAPVDPSVVNPAISSALSALVMKALSKDPALRFQSAQQMHGSLLQFLEGAAAPAPAAPVAAGPGGDKGSKAGAWALGIVIGLIVVGGIVVLLLGFAVGPKWFVSEDTGGTVTVPNLTGLTEDQARSSLDNVGLKMSRQDDYVTSESQQVGVVSGQNPNSGTSVAKGSSVTVKITTSLRMPNVMGQSQKDATSTLNNQKITNVVVNNVPVTDAAQVGKVVKQDPAAGVLISPGITATLQVGVESTTATVPKVTGDTQAVATTTLENAGFKVNAQQQSSATIPAGQVISQSPAANAQADKGSTVTIVVSTGP
jgi:eukaryotic-like serine/threonine-protein kinase